MIEVGHFSLILALVMALLQVILPFFATVLHNNSLQNIAKPLVIIQFVLISISFLFLINAFITDNFLVKYVAQNSNTNLPLIFKISAVWGAHEGSLLLWALILSIWSLAVSIFSKNIPQYTLNHILMVLGFISIGFLSFLLFTSNPFELLQTAPIQGRELNPLLQDIGLAIHPPMLYMGYVGMSVPFAFVISALIRGRLDSLWLRWSRPWTLIAWAFLTFGIVLGSWWAYYELGWGGWWFWDPVENASFMPWLAGAALIHSLSVSEKRGSFKHWSVLFAIAGFSLSLLGTFLVRSGVLTSVHSFASDPERGVFILAFLVIVVGFSLLLYSLRITTIKKSNTFALFSKESFLLLNNILFAGALFAVLLGTLFPLFLDIFNLSKISVGAPYFQSIFVPIMIVAVLFMALGSFVRWKADKILRIVKQLNSLWIAILIVFIIAFFITQNISVLIAIFLFIWVVAHSLYQLKLRIKSLTFSFIGMITAHIGIVVFILGATVTTQFGVEKDIKLDLGQTITIKDIEFTFKDIKQFSAQNYSGNMAIMSIKDNDKLIELRAEKRQYATGMPMTEAAIDASILRDLYIALGEDLGNNSWSFRIYYKPLVRLIWLGGLFIMLGALFAIFDKRYKRLVV